MSSYFSTAKWLIHRHTHVQKQPSPVISRVYIHRVDSKSSHIFQSFTILQFKVFDDEEVRAGLIHSRADHIISIDLLHSHSDPFYNECCAFGRIVQAGQNGRVAVRCYGHITLPAETKRDSDQKFKVTWNRPAEDCNKPVSKGLPFRAIVKEMVIDDIPLSRKIVNSDINDSVRDALDSATWVCSSPPSMRTFLLL